MSKSILKSFSLLLLLIVVSVSGCRRNDPAAPDSAVAAAPEKDYYSMIRSADKLILSEMTINKIATVEDIGIGEAKGTRQKWAALKNMFKIGTRKGAYSYNTYLQAYIDLSDFRPEDVEADTAAKVMKIRLPEIQTQFAGRDVEVKEEHYRVSGLRSNISAEERARVKEAMNEELKKEVEERSGFEKELKRTARRKAIDYFTAFAEDNGYTAEIIIKE